MGTTNTLDLNNRIDELDKTNKQLTDEIATKTKNFQGTIAEWNQLTTEEKKAYDHASIPNSIDGGVTFPANKVVMTGGGNVEDAIDEVAEKIISRIYTTKSSSTVTHGAYSWHANIEVEGYIPFMYCFQYGQSASAIIGCEGFSYTEMDGYCSVANLDIAIRVLYTKA